MDKGAFGRARFEGLTRGIDDGRNVKVRSDRVDDIHGGTVPDATDEGIAADLHHGIGLDRRQGCPDCTGKDFRRILVRITTGNRENDDLAAGIGSKILLASGEGKIVDVVHDRIAVRASEGKDTDRLWQRVWMVGKEVWGQKDRRRAYRVFTDRELAWKLLSKW